MTPVPAPSRPNIIPGIGAKFTDLGNGQTAWKYCFKNGSSQPNDITITYFEVSDAHGWVNKPLPIPAKQVHVLPGQVVFDEVAFANAPVGVTAQVHFMPGDPIGTANCNGDTRHSSEPYPFPDNLSYPQPLPPTLYLGTAKPAGGTSQPQDGKPTGA